MNEEVFLIFLIPAAAAIAFCLFLVSNWEAEHLWHRFRFSTMIWVSLTAIIAAGFINMSDSFTILGCWAVISGYLGMRILQSVHGAPWKRVVWFALVLLPVSGWILYFNRFPHLHADDAIAARMNPIVS